MNKSSPYIFDVEGHDFQERVIEASHRQPVLLDIWADWCSPCLALGPVLEKVIPEFEGRVLLAKLDADENMKIAGHYRVRGFPTVILFSQGEELERFTSARTPQFVRDFLDSHLPL